MVLDASAVVELLLWTERGERVAGLIDDPSVGIHSPHLLSIEVTQVLRRLWLDGELSARRADEALVDLASLDVNRHDHELLLPRIWKLRQNMTAYDAAYVALAELLNAPVVTFDQRLTRSPGSEARFLVP